MSAKEPGIRKDPLGDLRRTINLSANYGGLVRGTGVIKKPLTTSTGKVVTNPTQLTTRALVRNS